MASPLYVNDSLGSTWQIVVSEAGQLSTTSVGSQSPVALKLNDPSQATSWQITVSATGILLPTSITFDASLPGDLCVAASPSGSMWEIRVSMSGILSTMSETTVTLAAGYLMVMA